MIRFGSVCSGIESASVAWGRIGWEAAWFSEIEPFPCAVLAHHYPGVPNLGDMTRLAPAIECGLIEAPDVLVGGTPCQSFSVAGARAGMNDPRGALSLAYVKILEAMDAQRKALSKPAAVCVWENVPGVLSDRGNAFGHFLAALVGEPDALVPPGRKWENAGVVLGPKRRLAWRVLDAQYFGVAQRRRRVFVVASARDGFDPAKILFEFDGVRRDSAPSREPGQGFAADIAPSLVSSGRGVERVGETRGQDPVVAVAVAVAANIKGGLAPNGTVKMSETGFPLLASDYRDPQLVVALIEVGKRTGVSTTDKRAGVGIGRAGDPMFTLQAGAQHGVVAAFQSNASFVNANDGDISPTIRVGSGSSSGQPPAVVTSQTAVRRLTPRECERLQGFPDDYTLIPWRKKPAEDCPDGPRYKALGNSKCVNVVEWLGRRLAQAL